MRQRIVIWKKIHLVNFSRHWSMHINYAPKNKGRQFEDFIVTGGTERCLYENLRSHQRQQSCQIYDLLFSVGSLQWNCTNSWFMLSLSLSLSLPAWWRHQMETFSALLAICAGNSPVPGEFPGQRPVTRSFDVFFDLRPNIRLSKQSWGWWSETPSSSLWRHRNGTSLQATYNGSHESARPNDADSVCLKTT